MFMYDKNKETFFGDIKKPIQILIGKFKRGEKDA